MKYSLCADLLNSNKVYHYFLEKLPEYAQGKKSFMPWSVEIHPTAKCNHKCIHCSYKGRNEDRISLKKDIIEKLLKSIVKIGVKGVYFSGGGEPTLYPGIDSYIKFLHGHGVEVAVLTNGTAIYHYGIIEVADSLNYIAVSVPSTNLEKFKNITNSDQLDKVLTLPTVIKQRHGRNSPIIGSRIVITNVIFEDIKTILETMKKRRFDYALFKLVRDYEDRGLGLDQEKEEYLKKEIAALVLAGKIDDKFTNLRHIFEFKKDITFKNICHSNNMGMIANINPDGKVYPNIVEMCYEDFCIGDLNKKNLEEIWNSPKHNAVKEKSNKKWYEKRCNNCRAIAYNQIIDAIIANVPCEADPFL